MGYYYTDRPPERPKRWYERVIPGPIRRWWEGVLETSMMVGAVMGVLMPVMGALMGFILLLGFMVFLMGQCA